MLAFSMRAAVIFFVGIACFRLKEVDSFSSNFQRHLQSRNEDVHVFRTRRTTCRMVRNIDMVEALIFYGTSSLFHSASDLSVQNKQRKFVPGVEDLLHECKRDDTAVIAILECDENIMQECKEAEDQIIYKVETSTAPNPRDLWEAIHSIEIKPKGFGGSSGFGRKPPDPVRSPSPAHCVVLCDSVDRCRAARFAGMRVLCLTENHLADGVMNFGVEAVGGTDLESYWETINMDDIAMPGSFWLNPPHPKDDEGNSVDVLTVIESYNQREQRESSSLSQDGNHDDDRLYPEDDDLYLESILMDIDPL